MKMELLDNVGLRRTYHHTGHTRTESISYVELYRTEVEARLIGEIATQAWKDGYTLISAPRVTWSPSRWENGEYVRCEPDEAKRYLCEIVVTTELR